MPNTLPPPPGQPRPGQKSSPIDIQLAEVLRKYPGQETLYPLDARWPNEYHDNPHTIRKAANRLRSRIGQKWGAFARTEHGQFKIRARPTEFRIYIWYEPTDEEDNA